MKVSISPVTNNDIPDSSEWWDNLPDTKDVRVIVYLNDLHYHDYIMSSKREDWQEFARLLDINIERDLKEGFNYFFECAKTCRSIYYKIGNNNTGGKFVMSKPKLVSEILI